MLGAAYLIFLGVKSIINAFQKSPVQPKVTTGNNQIISLRVAFSEGLITNVLNPKVSMFYLAAFPQFMSNTESALSAYTLVAAHSIVNFLWFTMVIMVLSKVKKVTNNTRLKTWLNSITGTVFIAFGSKLALTTSS